MKLKENKGMSLIVFTIILAVLLVVAGCVIAYLLNNQGKENVAIQNQTETQTNKDNSENKVNTNVNNEENSKYMELLKISLDRYIYYLSFLGKFDDISKANLESVVEYSLFDANFAHFDGEDWILISDDKNDIISEVAKRFDISNSTIKNKIKNMNIDPEWVARYGEHDYSGDGFPKVTYSKIQDIKYIENNKYEVNAIQFDILRNDDGYGKVTSIGISSEDGYKETNVEADSHESDITDSLIADILNYAKTNNIGNRTFTIEVNENYSMNSVHNYLNNGSFRLLSIK